jgi:hypothetical protein
VFLLRKGLDLTVEAGQVRHNGQNNSAEVDILG